MTGGGERAMEEFGNINGFPGYSVSVWGRVRRDSNGRIMALTRNQQGIINVGLTRDRIQYKRSLAILVARAFLPEPSLPNFSTPIHLDGDQSNCRADNLMWRPRWFAVKYHQQFRYRRRPSRKPIREVHTGEVFKNAWTAALTFGLLERDILMAIHNRTYVTPTFQVFEVMAE